MKVYVVVLSIPYEGDDIKAVFDSYENAKKYIDESESLFIKYYEVREYEVRGSK